MRLPSVMLVGAMVLLAGCSSAPDRKPLDGTAKRVAQPFTSSLATLLDFELDGEVWTDADADPQAAITAQLKYTIGHLNAQQSVTQMQSLAITNIVSEPDGDGVHLTYHASVPVAWAGGANPETYTFTVPKVSTDAALSAFAAKYNKTCVVAGEEGAGDIWSMWYFYRPADARCALDPADVVSFTAMASVDAGNTTGKYPEYDQVWADNTLNVIALFSREGDGATSNSDSGIYQFNHFVAAIKQELAPYGATTVPAGVSNTPGVANPEVSISATLPDGRMVNVYVRLVGYRLYQDGDAFDAWYDPLTPTADAIFYNGHAGLGQNVQTLVSKGTFVPGQYLMLHINGCDTFAYVDRTLADRRAVLNPDDPTGTKYMDIIQNAMPAYFTSLTPTSMTLFRGLMNTQAPPSYQTMFATIDPAQVVVVTGEEDNVFQPVEPNP
jgi:hypothetical protein